MSLLLKLVLQPDMFLFGFLFKLLEYGSVKPLSSRLPGHLSCASDIKIVTSLPSLFEIGEAGSTTVSSSEGQGDGGRGDSDGKSSRRPSRLFSKASIGGSSCKSCAVAEALGDSLVSRVPNNCKAFSLLLI